MERPELDHINGNPIIRALDEFLNRLDVKYLAGEVNYKDARRDAQTFLYLTLAANLIESQYSGDPIIHNRDTFDILRAHYSALDGIWRPTSEFILDEAASYQAHIEDYGARGPDTQGQQDEVADHRLRFRVLTRLAECVEPEISGD